MWTLVLPIVAILAVAQLVVVFRPKLWVELRQTGVRWHHYGTFVVTPVVLALLLASTLASRVGGWKPWMILLASFVISTWLVMAALAFRGIRGIRRGDETEPEG